ncbi:MAG: tRNA (adenosine(37)-N6)-dimethylallyltransferase MiaA [Rickettsiales bacterium]
MGPTGSGKSALALRIAQAAPTVIINADAMQLVADLRILTARPTRADEALAEHALYGVLDAGEPTSVARWLMLVEPVIRTAWDENKQPLLVGGTGMYVQALMQGLASIPPIPEAIRAPLRALTAPELYARLSARDSAMAASLKPGDTQRLARALEVVEATGQSLAHWQQQKAQPLFPDATYRIFALTPDRAQLYPRLNARFEAMLAAGAMDEITRLMARQLPPDTPILRAHGVPELMAHARGEITLEAATTHAQQLTRNYAKRQLTWIRQQLPEVRKVQPDENLNTFFTL